MQEVRLPRYQDAPRRMWFWAMDEAMVYIGCVGVGFWFDCLMLMLGVGYLVQKFYAVQRDGRPEGFIVHTAYWLGFFVPKGWPNPFIRRWFP